MAKKSNLGDYQTMTTLAKIFHGPKNLGALIFVGGVAVGAIGRNVYTQIKENKKKYKENLEELNNKIYEVRNYGISNEGLVFNVGDMYKVLKIVEDSDAVLIEKIGDDNNPYTVSAKLLSEISDFTI